VFICPGKVFNAEDVYSEIRNTASEEMIYSNWTYLIEDQVLIHTAKCSLLSREKHYEVRNNAIVQDKI